MNSSDKKISRRDWLRLSALAGATLGVGGAANLMLGARVSAQAVDYKALVGIFLYGGNDGLNTVVPTDATRYGQYSTVRAGLAIPQASLVGLGGTQFGLHPSLAALAPVWNAGRLTAVFNVGPLYAPVDKTTLRAAPANSPLIPDSLFSHSDQQVLWETATTDALTRTGWGGRASETMGTVNPVISVGGNGHFGLANATAPLVLPSPGDDFGAYELGSEPWRLSSTPYVARANALRAMYTHAQDSDLGEAFTRMQRDAFAVSDRLGALVKTTPGGTGAVAAIDAAFAPVIASGRLTTDLAEQLYQVAKLVAGNATVQGTRQIFFAQKGGFDTHGNQLVTGAPLEGTHARLLKELGDALACFHNAMAAIGMGDKVTVFTQSDFGRTFVPNNSTGTDHAWGNTHLVLGGAVQGSRTYGTYPTLQLGGPDDIGVDSWELQGRWIPTTSVDQYAATLLGWFGATDSQLDAVLPNLVNFGANRRLGFV